MKTKLLLIFFLCCVLLSCRNKNEIIEIVYFPGLIDTSVPFVKEDFIKVNNEEIGDTIIVTPSQFSEVLTFIKTRDNFVYKKKTFNERIYLKFGRKECLIGFLVERNANEYSEYSIKCISEYYNYFEEEDMLYDRDIVRYGVPKNYKCLLSDSVIPPSAVKKVLKCEKLKHGHKHD